MNYRNIKVVDEHSIDRNANIMFAFDLEGSEYVTYWIERDEDNGNIFVSKVIKNLDGHSICFSSQPVCHSVLVLSVKQYCLKWE